MTHSFMGMPALSFVIIDKGKFRIKRKNMVALDTVNHWLVIPKEDEHIEFKEAKRQYDTTKLLEYCIAISNEGGGHFVLGVTDKRPRKIVGTQAFLDLGKIKSLILSELQFRVEVHELQHADGRVLVFEIPSRPKGMPRHLKGRYLMRCGEEIVPMTSDHLRRIYLEGETPDWLTQAAKTDVSGDEVIALLDTQTYFDLMKLPYPGTEEGILAHLASERLIVALPERYLLAKLTGQRWSPSVGQLSSRIKL